MLDHLIFLFIKRFVKNKTPVNCLYSLIVQKKELECLFFLNFGTPVVYTLIINVFED